MIIYQKGDLLASPCTVIGHCANCFNVMGAGIARQIAIKFPGAWTADQKTAPGDRRKLGTFSKWKGPVTIYNLYGQYGFGAGKQVDYYMLQKALTLMRDDLNADDIVGFPRLGTGLAGGSWEEIECILLEVFKDRIIYVYDL